MLRNAVSEDCDVQALGLPLDTQYGISSVLGRNSCLFFARKKPAVRTAISWLWD